MFSGSVTGVAAAADINITAFTGSPALAAGRYFFAFLPVQTVAGGVMRVVYANSINTAVAGNVVDQLQQQSGLVTLPASATPAAFTPGNQVFWRRLQVALP